MLKESPERNVYAMKPSGITPAQDKVLLLLYPKWPSIDFYWGRLMVFRHPF